MSGKSATKAGIGYTIGNILVRAISFISLPIFTRLMSTSEYGLYTTYVSYQSIIAIFVSMGLYVSLKIANIEFRGKIDDYVSCISFIPIFIFVILYVILLVLGNVIVEFTGFSFLVLSLMLINALASSFLNIYNNRVSLDFAYKKYLAISFLYAIFSVLISLLLMISIMKKQIFEARVLGTVVPLIFIGIYVSGSLLSKAKPRLSKKYITFGVKYSLPMIPHGLSQIVLAQFGKIVIQKTISNAAAGIYGFAYTIVLIPQVLTTSFDSAWGPWFFEQYDNKNYDVIKKNTTLIVLVFSLLIFVICSVSPEIIVILGNQTFWDSKFIIIPAILGAYFAFLYILPAQIEYFHKKTKFIAIGTVFAAVLNILGCVIFVPKYGYESAVYVTLVTYILYFVAHMLIAKRIKSEHFPMNVHEICLCIMLTCIFCFVSQLLISNWLLRYSFMGIVILITLLYKKDDILTLVKSLKK